MNLTFQAAGSLWRDALVIEDMETRSLWSQVSGECISGEMESMQLSPYPSAITTFSEFKKQYPHGMVPAKSDRGAKGSAYGYYFEDDSQLGLFGRADDFSRLKGKQVVYGLLIGKERAAISRDHLLQTPLVLFRELSFPIVVTFDSATASASAFAIESEIIDSCDLYLVDDRLLSGNGKAAWNARTGRVISGKGEALVPLPLTTAYWFAWVSFFPETELIK